jgi:hypothetical protein
MNKTLSFIGFALTCLLQAQIALAWEQPFLGTIGSSDSLHVTGDGSGSLTLIVWAVKAAALVATTTLLYFTGKRLHTEDYYGAFWTFVAAMIAGASPLLAETLFLG